MRVRVAWLLFAWLAVAPGLRANPMSTYGYTARAIGLGGAMTAAARSFDATWYNPAGLARIDAVEVGFGLALRRTFLTARHAAATPGADGLQAVETQRGATGGALDLGLATPLPLGDGLERVFFAGVSLSLPGTTLYAVRERPVQQPVFPFLEERNDRLVLNAALAARWGWVALGAGVSFLPAVEGRVDVDFTDGARQNLASVDVGTSLSPSVGLLVLPVEGLSLGLTWRGEARLDLDIPVRVVISEKITPVDLRVTAVDHSSPHELALGAAWQGEGWLVTGEATYAFYRRFDPSFPEVALFSEGEGDTGTAAAPDGRFHDTFAVRAGTELRVARGLDLRFGASWVQSPVPAQTGATNLLDGDRYAGSVGLGLDLAACGGPPLNVDAAVAGGGLVGNRDAKAVLDPANPGYPTIEGGGGYVQGTLSTSVRF